MTGAAALLALGIHLATAHSAPGLNDKNPGLYVRAGALAAGVYRNSHNVTSAWAGYTWETDRRQVGPVYVRGAVTAGGVTGYPRAPVMPMVNASAAADLGGPVAVRLTFIPNPLPKGAHGLHLSFEVDL
jgi:hypothetical protein